MEAASEIPEIEKWKNWRCQTVAERHAFFLERAGFLKSPEALVAFRAVDRADFLRPQDIHLSMVDMPIPIGHEQSNSQPSLVAAMVEALRVRPGDKVLDVGSGSGWTAALLGNLAEPDGAVFGAERIPELAELARYNLGKYELENVRIKQSDELDCWADEGPFDAIMVAATAEELPPELADQLAEGGRMVIPIGKDLAFVGRRNGTVEIEGTLSGVDFVPLVTS